MFLQRKLILSITFGILLSIMGCATSGKEVRQRMNFEAASQDLCSIEQGKMVDNIFKFKNTDSDTLKIDRVYSS
jgi:hypothetical protein